ncbi:MAG TPA: GFA family protein [Geminicoccaceae bacterium]|nr:GFA family protein [Geminicoccaceae bacterium]
MLRGRGLRPLSGPERVRTGRCRCGAIRFEARGRPNWVAYCHCESCRRATGAPVAAYAGFPATAVRFTDGPPTEFASSPGVSRGFCARCGSPVSFTGERWPGEVHLHLGCFDDGTDLVPDREAFAEERLPWLHLRVGG